MLPKRMKKDEARNSLPEEPRPTFDKLCEETLFWSQTYYGTSFISYSIIKELVESAWTKVPLAPVRGEEHHQDQDQ
jgi:hypothetical protein